MLLDRLMGKWLSRMARPIPPGTSSWPARAKRVWTARIAWSPVFEYSSPVYMMGQAPDDVAIRRARRSTVSAGTPVISSTTSGRKCWT